MVKKDKKGALAFKMSGSAKTRPVNSAQQVSHRETPAEYRWKPGQSGNPSGRPSAEHKALKDAVKSKLEAVEHRQGKCNLERLIDNTFRRALQGKDKLTELLFAYYFGRPVQQQINVNREVTEKPVYQTTAELEAELRGLFEKLTPTGKARIFQADRPEDKPV